MAETRPAEPVAEAPRHSLLGYLDLRSHWPTLVIGLVIGCLGLGIGAYVTTEGARHTGELALDVMISRHRDFVLSDIGLAFQVGFGPMIAPLVLLVTCAVVWVKDHLAALVTALLTIPGWFSVEVGKFLFHRARPPAGVVHALVNEQAPDSFPSGHTAFVAALVIALFVVAHGHRRTQGWVAAIGIPLVLLVAATRLEVGAHYLGDVVAAPMFALGTILVLVAIGGPVATFLRQKLPQGA
ncbi:MAG TPA: phosphatase PAP2 family protein [Segeticoccus sp.]|uniref:phosphatase PAP2 family protein n=1 Tax=Segeticoccus sp. TaxID=2706531 RepID=UPI002D7F09F3|nr:phosphatase PAP2 family protein [Segeticoccus sp.]HET8599083.1 phosphatase PAP2 family protein [Segeticoccus sp.]